MARHRSPGHCGCRNRRGRPKTMFRSYDNALKAVLGHYLHANGQARVYECPVRAGRYHITSKRDR